METMEAAISCGNSAARFPCGNSLQFRDNFSLLPSTTSPKTVPQYGMEEMSPGGGGKCGDYTWPSTELVLELVAKLPTELRMTALGLPPWALGR
jgi:hypothetical protein